MLGTLDEEGILPSHAESVCSGEVLSPIGEPSASFQLPPFTGFFATEEEWAEDASVTFVLAQDRARIESALPATRQASCWMYPC